MPRHRTSPASPAAGARQTTAAQQGDAKTGPLFVAKADNLDGLRQMPPLLVQVVHHFDGGEHPEHAVVAPGVAYGVQMRAEQHRLRPSCAPS